MDKKQDRPSAPKHKRRVKSFVDLTPTTEEIRESVDERLDELIRYGLGDQSHLAFYRQALSDPRSSVNNVQYRKYVGESLARLLELILSDQALFVRVRTLLQTRGRSMTNEELSLMAVRVRADLNNRD